MPFVLRSAGRLGAKYVDILCLDASQLVGDFNVKFLQVNTEDFLAVLG